MSQVKVYGLEANLERNRTALSKAIHEALVSVLRLPEEKKFQRFIALQPEEFVFPDDRSDNYVIVELMMFTERQVT